jgi:membrane fusion protein, multidrug efflux system
VKKPLKIIIFSLIGIVILGLIIIPKIISKNEKSSDSQKQNPGQQNQPISVDAYILKSQTLDNDIKAIGTIRANEEVEIRSEVSRKIKGIFFKEGSSVSRGQTLFKLDSDDLIARLRKQEVEEKLGISQLAREKELVDKGLTSQESYDVKENTLEKTRADIAITKIDISKTYINAPFSGIIGLRKVSNGSYVTPDLVLTTIQDISKVKIDFSIPEKYIYLFKKGEKVQFKVEGLDDNFEGVVFAYEPKVENNTRSLVLRAVCNNPGRKLLPGTFANVTFKISQDDNALMIPSQSLVPKLKGQSVYVVKDGKAMLLDVEIGERTEDFIQIISNTIQSGDTIITTNILRLKNDAPVKVSKVE